MNSTNHVVRSVLARHTRRDTGDVRASDDLYGDLRLTMLGLALVILDIEDILDVRIAMPDLDSIQRVEDLTSLARDAAARPNHGTGS